MDGAYEPFIYQWKRDGIDLVDDATISGANTDTLTFTGALTADSDSDFSVGVTDTNNNEVVSRSALLTVGDFDPPLVHTLPTSHAQSLIRAARAVVVGQVNPNGLPANVEVFWGTSANTLNRTTAASPSVAPNTATTTRIGMLVIGGETHTVVQNGVLAPQISVPTEIPAGIVSGDYHLVIPTVNPPVTFNTTPTENPARVRLTSLNPATGLFSGILTLSDENPDRAFLREARPITFQGVLLLDEAIGTGYFLLNELSAPPPPPQKGLNAPVESLSFKASRR